MPLIHDGFRIDYFDEKLIVKWPTAQHEFIRNLLPKLLNNQGHSQSIRLGGSTDIPLFGGKETKSPDESFHDDSNSNDPQLNDSAPTVVWEVGVSQTLAKLNYDAARILIGTLGRTQLVVNVKIEIQAMELMKISMDLWEVVISYMSRPFLEGGSVACQCNRILTAEGEPAKPTTVGWEFHYFSQEENQYLHYCASPFSHHLVSQSNGVLPISLVMGRFFRTTLKKLGKGTLTSIASMFFGILMKIMVLMSFFPLGFKRFMMKSWLLERSLTCMERREVVKWKTSGKRLEGR